ncbi:hypothetical protein TNCV_1078811 [Trichonephila clavipes]|nr:hypothetical protein TNCV_1078811 [Trichonephila clavipes]
MWLVLLNNPAPLSTRKCKFVVRSLTNNRNLRQALYNLLQHGNLSLILLQKTEVFRVPIPMHKAGCTFQVCIEHRNGSENSNIFLWGQKRFRERLRDLGRKLLRSFRS